jgi:hypothetical protein
MRRKKFFARSFVAFVVMWAFIAATVTGVVLYIVPQGRVAYWVDWQLISLTKEDWSNIHIIFGLIFIVVGGFHLYYNWRPIKHYFADRVAGHTQLRREIIVASLVSVLALAGAIYQLPPVKWLFDLNGKVKDAWVIRPEFEPPFGHAEELSLAGFAKRQRIDLEAAVAELRAKGVRLDSTRETLKKIARANGTNPMNIYMLISKFEKKIEVDSSIAYTAEMIEEQFAGAGLGRKTLAQVSAEIGVPLDKAKLRLTQAAIKVADDEKLREGADRHSIGPIDILKHILVEGYKG